MEFTMRQSELMQALNAIKAPLKGGRFASEILNHVLIEARNGEVSFTTTDLSMRVTTVKKTVKVGAEGAYTVDYQQFVETIKALPKGADITFQQLESQALITCSGCKFIRGMETEEYPVWELMHAPGSTYTKQKREYESDRSGGCRLVTNTYVYEVLSTQMQQLSLPCNQLVGMLNQVAYAAAKDESRPILKGVFLELKDDRLTLIASDGFAMVEHVAELPCAGSWEQSVIIDAKALVQIAKLLPKNSDVTIAVDITMERLLNSNGKTILNAQPFLNIVQVRFAAENTVVSLLPLEGMYPDLRSVIPTTGTTCIVCCTADLLSGYQALWPVAKDASNITRLRTSGDMVRIEAQPDEQPEPTVHEVSALVTGPQKYVTLNCEYIRTFLKATKAEEVSIELNAPEQAVLFRPRGSGIRYIIMPLHVNR